MIRFYHLKLVLLLLFHKNIDPLTDTDINEIIKKIKIAKKNLFESLIVINKLQIQAEQNKKEVDIGLTKVSDLKKNRESLENEITNIKNIIDSDIETFRKIAGIPSAKAIRRERVIGFIIGIIASIIASLLIWGIFETYKIIFK